MRVLRDLGSDAPAAEIAPAVKEKLQAFLTARVPGGADTVVVAQAVVEQLGKKFPQLKADIQTEVGAVFATASKLERQLDQWFDTVMNRLSDIFTRMTRTITVVISLVIVFTLHIDSGDLLRQIIHSPDLRAKLMAMSDTALSQADKLLENAQRGSAAVAEVKKAHANKLEDTKLVAALDNAPHDLTRCVDGRNWLAKNPKDFSDAVLDEFDKACQSATDKALGTAYADMRNLQTELKQTDLKIVPLKIGNCLVFDSSANWFATFGDARHLAGVLVSALLLSLGAPFWFNTLRQLSSSTAAR